MKRKTQSQILHESISKMKEYVNSDTITKYADNDEGKIMMVVANQMLDSVLVIIKDMSMPFDIEEIKNIYNSAKMDMAEGINLSGEEFFNKT
jgi:hypothetical protein